MVDTLRKRISALKDFAELDYIAVLGKWSGVAGANPDVSYYIVHGDSPAQTAGTDYQIWPQSGDMGLPTSAETLDIVSSSIQDDAGGSGIDAVFIEGLDGDFNPVSELVLLDGTTTVNSTNTYIHVREINCLNVTTSGTTNAGNITITNTTSGDNLGYIRAGDSISEHGQFVVPAGYNALLMSIDASCFRTSGSGVKRCEIDLYFVPLDGGAGDRIEYKTIKFGISSEGVSEIVYPLPLVIGQKVAFIPHTNAESNSTETSVQFELLLIKDTVDIDSVF